MIRPKNFTRESTSFDFYVTVSYALQGLSRFWKYILWLLPVDVIRTFQIYVGICILIAHRDGARMACLVMPSLVVVHNMVDDRSTVRNFVMWPSQASLWVSEDPAGE